MTRRAIPPLLLLLAILLFASTPPVRADAPPLPTKELAAPPSDFASLRLPDPAEHGVLSHSTLVPISIARDPEGVWGWSGALTLDADRERSLLLLPPPGRSWRPVPGTTLSDGATIEAERSALALGGSEIVGSRLAIPDQAPGVLHLQIASDGPGDGFLLVSNEGAALRLYSHLQDYELHVGRALGLTAYLTDAERTDGARPRPVDARVDRAILMVRFPDGDTLVQEMRDDGKSGDGAVGDGLYGAQFVPKAAGDYFAVVTVEGSHADGVRFSRSTQHFFPVIEPGITLQSAPVRAIADDGGRLRLPLVIDGAAAAERVRVYAELWGRDTKGNRVPVVWIGGQVSPTGASGGTTIPLSLDARWIARAGATAPFELRHVRVHDIETHIPLARRDRLEVSVGRLPAAAMVAPERVDATMLMGERPAGTPTIGPGRLLLVHGYCAPGNPWPTTHFSRYAEFNDPGQNRSHDAFAREIRDFGASFPSFGIVAHSQGGAAALHLYTYYWSGLDYSSGSRLIQSVGTPYRGTALAGNLALLGDIFGVGCGANWELTYDGAALWLSGIPSWARSRIFYATTSPATAWWRWDYCQFASDLILADPDDGVIERWAGQLAGAKNLGHKRGWCHTDAMRDPAQVTDYARNRNMDLYANR